MQGRITNDGERERERTNDENRKKTVKVEVGGEVVRR